MMNRNLNEVLSINSLKELHMTEDQIIGWVWGIGEIICVLAITLDYVLNSDNRSKYAQSSANEYYGIFILGWPLVLPMAVVITIGASMGWLGLNLLKLIKLTVYYFINFNKRKNNND